MGGVPEHLVLFSDYWMSTLTALAHCGTLLIFLVDSDVVPDMTGAIP